MWDEIGVERFWTGGRPRGLKPAARSYGKFFGISAVHLELVITILGIGVSLILGIAHEDAGRWSASTSTEVRRDA